MSVIFISPEEAEDAFYEAIARGDLDALMNIWAEDEEVVCIHPTGQCVTGHAAIRESWRQIFAGNPRFNVRIRRRIQWKGMLIATHSIIEMLCLEGEETAHGPMLSTNVFHRGAHGWRLISRHTSAADDSATDDDADTLTHTLH